MFYRFLSRNELTGFMQCVDYPPDNIEDFDDDRADARSSSSGKGGKKSESKALAFAFNKRGRPGGVRTPEAAFLREAIMDADLLPALRLLVSTDAWLAGQGTEYIQGVLRQLIAEAGQTSAATDTNLHFLALSFLQLVSSVVCYCECGMRCNAVYVYMCSCSWLIV